MNIYQSMFLGGAAGIIGTGLGGLAALFIKNGKKTVSYLLEFAAGLMIGISIFDLLPESLCLAKTPYVFSGLILGVAITAALGKFVDTRKGIGEKGSLLGCGIITLVGISMHNFFEGIAIGSGFAVSNSLGFSILAVIAFHDLPEGVAMAAPLKGGGVGTSKVVLLAALSGVPTLIGAALGAAAGGISNDVVGFCLAVACGTMLFVSFADIIPSSKKLFFSKWQAILNIAGLFLGFAATKVF